MALLEAAGLPPGVINLVTGDGQAVSRVALSDPDLAGIHFTGSTGTFQHLWRTVGQNIERYRDYPRLVGETGGKDFVIVHPSADPASIATTLVRGAFEYQGQKCSAASRAYLPASLWAVVKDELIAATESIRYGDVSEDLSLFGGAVIDARAADKHRAAFDRARSRPSVSFLAGGQVDDETGYFVAPTVLECTDPGDEVFTTEYFGPILAVHVYQDADYSAMLGAGRRRGAVRADRLDPGHRPHRDRGGVRGLRYSAGNFYVNDKPTGAVVGQQPFGGARASGTDDKAGSVFNLIRWVSARVDQGDVRPADRLPLPPYGMNAPRPGYAGRSGAMAAGAPVLGVVPGDETADSPAGAVEHRPDAA